MNLTKIKTYYGFAVKSGKIVYGTDNILKAKPLAIFISEAISENAKNKLKRMCDDYECCMINLDQSNMENITTNQNIMAFGITDKNLAEAIINCME